MIRKMKPGLSMPSMAQPSRRRVLSYGIGTLSALALSRPRTALGDSPSGIHEWTGTALGAPGRILIAHDKRKIAHQAIQQALMELERIEDQFSLYRDTSALSRLNRNGSLDNPSLDMRHLIGLSKHMGALSGGAFDVTVQPVWATIAEHVSHNSSGTLPTEQRLREVRQLVDYRLIEITDRQITMAEGMAITLNGIAQGYATDRVVDVLRAAGYANALVELGEAYGAGERTPGRAWQLGIREAGPDSMISLSGKAVAVSSRNGTMFSALNGYSHILDPHTGRPKSGNKTVYVVHGSAAIADALSTALCVMPSGQARQLITQFTGAHAYEVMENGVTVAIG